MSELPPTKRLNFGAASVTDFLGGAEQLNRAVFPAGEGYMKMPSANRPVSTIFSAFSSPPAPGAQSPVHGIARYITSLTSPTHRQPQPLKLKTVEQALYPPAPNWAGS